MPLLLQHTIRCLQGGNPFDNDDGIKRVTVFTKTVTLLFPFVVDRKCAATCTLNRGARPWSLGCVPGELGCHQSRPIMCTVWCLLHPAVRRDLLCSAYTLKPSEYHDGLAIRPVWCKAPSGSMGCVPMRPQVIFTRGGSLVLGEVADRAI